MTVTKHEASRNFMWRTAGLILHCLAERSMSTERVEVSLGWEIRRLTRFLTSAVNDNMSDQEALTVHEIAVLMDYLGIDCRLIARFPEVDEDDS